MIIKAKTGERFSDIQKNIKEYYFGRCANNWDLICVHKNGIVKCGSCKMITVEFKVDIKKEMKDAKFPTKMV
jgi:hypothetical protein